MGLFVINSVIHYMWLDLPGCAYQFVFSNGYQESQTYEDLITYDSARAQRCDEIGWDILHHDLVKGVSSNLYLHAVFHMLPLSSWLAVAHMGLGTTLMASRVMSILALWLAQDKSQKWPHVGETVALGRSASPRSCLDLMGLRSHSVVATCCYKLSLLRYPHYITDSVIFKGNRRGRDLHSSGNFLVFCSHLLKRTIVPRYTTSWATTAVS